MTSSAQTLASFRRWNTYLRALPRAESCGWPRVEYAQHMTVPPIPQLARYSFRHLAKMLPRN